MENISAIMIAMLYAKKCACVRWYVVCVIVASFKIISK